MTVIHSYVSCPARNQRDRLTRHHSKLEANCEECQRIDDWLTREIASLDAGPPAA